MNLNLQTAGASRRTVAILCAVAAVLQVALAPQVSILGGGFNFMLALVAVLCVTGESRMLVYIGFFAGLFHDLTGSAPIGLMALLLTLAGYVGASAFRGVGGGLTAGSLRAAGVIVAAVNIVYALALFLMGAQGSLVQALVGHALASTVLTVLACIPLLAAAGSGEQGRGFTAGAKRGPVLGGGRPQRRGSRFKGMR